MLALPSKGAFGSAVGADTAAGPPLIIAPGELGGPEGRSSAGMAGELTSCAKAGTAPNKTVENITQTSGDVMAFHSECICGNCTQRADAALSALAFFPCRRRPAEFRCLDER